MKSSPQKSVAANCIVLGATGAGKTYLINDILSQSLCLSKLPAKRKKKGGVQ